MRQLHYFDNQMNLFHDWLIYDPVRPNIPRYMRYGHNRGIFVLTEDGHPQAISCCAFIGEIPPNEERLLADHDEFNVAVFYTVWAMENSTKGSGRMIINQGLNHIRWFKPHVKYVVTLSPKTEMARKFHLSNGATVYRENEDTINYEYRL